MARMRVDGFDDLEKMFQRMMRGDEIAAKAVNKAAPVLVKSVKASISSKTGKGFSTGELAASVSYDPAKKNQYGIFSVIRPRGTHSNGESNAKIGNILEHGHRGGYTNKRGQQVGPQEAAPWRDPALNSARSECEEIMRQVVYEEMGCK